MPGKDAAKAYVGALLAGVSASLAVLFTVLADDIVTTQEWVGVASAFVGPLVAVFGGVYFTPNAEKVPRV